MRGGSLSLGKAKLTECGFEGYFGSLEYSFLWGFFPSPFKN